MIAALRSGVVASAFRGLIGGWRSADFQQSLPSECGTACARLILSLRGVPSTEDMPRAGRDGTTAAQVSALLSARGVRSRVLSSNLAVRLAYRRPLVALTENAHYIVLFPYGGRHFLAFDPAQSSGMRILEAPTSVVSAVAPVSRTDACALRAAALGFFLSQCARQSGLTLSAAALVGLGTGFAFDHAIAARVGGILPTALASLSVLVLGIGLESMQRTSRSVRALTLALRAIDERDSRLSLPFRVGSSAESAAGDPTSLPWHTATLAIGVLCGASIRSATGVIGGAATALVIGNAWICSSFLVLASTALSREVRLIKATVAPRVAELVARRFAVSARSSVDWLALRGLLDHLVSRTRRRSFALAAGAVWAVCTAIVTGHFQVAGAAAVELSHLVALTAGAAAVSFPLARAWGVASPVGATAAFTRARRKYRHGVPERRRVAAAIRTDATILASTPNGGFELQVPSLFLPAGALVAITGNGRSGKSLLLAFLAGDIPAQRHSRVVVGRDGGYLESLPFVAGIDSDAVLGDGPLVALVVRASIEGTPRHTLLSRAAQLSRDLGIAVPLSSQIVGGGAWYSHSERQLLRILLGLASAPDILFADDPFAHLHFEDRTRAIDAIVRAQATRIVVTAEPELLEQADLVLSCVAGVVRVRLKGET